MKRPRQSIYGSEKGSALLAALCFCAVLGIALASYMAVCTQTLHLSNRNTQGTHSLELAENGLEEALWSLNKNDWTGWTLDNTSSPKVATKTLEGFSFGNGVTGVISLSIENYNDSNPSNPRTLKVSGITTLADGSTVKRTLQSKAKRAPLFVNAVAATGTASSQSDGGFQPTGVYFASGGTVDSFDSTNSATGTGYSAVISSASRARLTNASIKGYIAATNGLSDYSYLAHLAGPGTPASIAIDPSRLSTSPYQPVFDLKAPSASTPLPAGSATIGDTATTYYYAEDVNLASSDILTVVGSVVIVVSGDFKIQESAQIVVQEGGSLQVLMTGTTGELLIGGLGIKNQTTNNIPKCVAIFSAATAPTADPTIATSTRFDGVVYVPYSNRDLVVSSDLVVRGSIVAKNVRITGSPTIRYDVDLQAHPPAFSGIDSPFAISAWQEITP